MRTFHGWEIPYKQQGTDKMLRRDTRPRIGSDSGFGDRTKNVLKSAELRAKGFTCERELIPRMGGKPRKDKKYEGGKRSGCPRSNGSGVRLTPGGASDPLLYLLN